MLFVSAADTVLVSEDLSEPYGHRKDMTSDNVVAKIHLHERQDSRGHQRLWTAWIVRICLGLFPGCKTPPILEYGCMTSAKAVTSVCLADQATNLFILAKGFRQLHDVQEDVYFSLSLIHKIMGSNR